MSYQLTDVELLAETDKAQLIQLPLYADEMRELEVNNWWIPISVILDTDLEDVGDEGEMEIEDRFAENSGIKERQEEYDDA